MKPSRAKEGKAPTSEQPCDLSPLSPEATERRVRLLTPVIACGMAVGAVLIWEVKVGVGVAIGGGLAYLNFIWMRASLQSIVAATAGKTDSSRQRPSRFQMAKFFSALDCYWGIHLVVCAGCIWAGCCHSMRPLCTTASCCGGSSSPALVRAKRQAGDVTFEACGSTPHSRWL